MDLTEIKLDNKICEIIGAFIGDGYIGKYNNIYTIGFAGNQKLDEDYINRHLFNLIIKKFPYTNPHVKYRNDENTIMLRVYSKRLFNLFINLGFKPGKKSHSVEIPSLILENKQFMNFTIRGIFDTDGCIFFDRRKSYKKPYPRITLQTASIPLINQLEVYLSKTFKLYVSKSNRDGYRNYIEIYGHKQLERFLKQIGFSNKRHLDRICLCSSVVERQT